MLVLAAIVTMLQAVPPAAAEAALTEEEAYSEFNALGFELNPGFTLDDVLAEAASDGGGGRMVTMDELMQIASELAAGHENADHRAAGPRPSRSGTSTAQRLAWEMGGAGMPGNGATGQVQPFSNDFAAIDFERIANAGDYARLMQEMARLAEGKLVISGAEDTLPSEWQDWEGLTETQLRFRADGRAQAWTLTVDGDWVDPDFFERFDALIRSADPQLGLYSFSHGQSDLFFVSSPETAASLARLVGESVRDWHGNRGGRP